MKGQDNLAAAYVSTHDLPILAGWWNGADIREKHDLGLIDGRQADHADSGRTREKTMLVDLLREPALLTKNVDVAHPMPMSVAVAVHGFVCATPCPAGSGPGGRPAGEAVAVNLPGTDRERPNWRRRIDTDDSALCRTPLAEAILSALRPPATDMTAACNTALDSGEIGRC